MAQMPSASTIACNGTASRAIRLSSRSCAPRPLLPTGEPRAFFDRRRDPGDPERVAGREQKTLLAAREADHDRIVKGRLRQHGRAIGAVIVRRRMEMDRRDRDLAAHQPVEPRL